MHTITCTTDIRGLSHLHLLLVQVISACYGLIVIRILKTNVGDTQNSNSESTYSRRGSGVRIWSRKRRRSSNASTGKSYREKRRVTVMCAVLVLLFLVCWLPFHSIHLAKIVGIPSSDVSRMGFSISKTYFSQYNPKASLHAPETSHNLLQNNACQASKTHHMLWPTFIF